MSGHPLRGKLGGKQPEDPTDPEAPAPDGEQAPSSETPASSDEPSPPADSASPPSSKETEFGLDSETRYGTSVEPSGEPPTKKQMLDLTANMEVDSPHETTETPAEGTIDPLPPAKEEEPEFVPEPMSHEPLPEPLEPESVEHSEWEQEETVDWEADPVGTYEPVEDVPATAGARRLLATALLVAGIGWLGFVGWSVGRSIASGLSPQDIALWVTMAVTPLILLALLWTIFGRTRRKEAEAFTRQVAAMRAEASQLDERLASMSHNLGANRSRLGELAGELEGRADQAAQRIHAVSADLEQGAQRLAEHGSSLDNTTSAARADMTALLAAMPDAEQRVGALSQQLQGAADSAANDTKALEAAIASLAARANESESRMQEAGKGLGQQLSALDQVGGEALTNIERAQKASGEMVDGLLARTATTLEEIRSGIATQAEAVDALVKQAQSGLDQSASGAASQLASRLAEADGALTRLGERVKQQDDQSRVMLANLDSGLGALEDRFDRFSTEGDTRASDIGAKLQAVREQLSSTLAEARDQDGMLDSLATRTEGMRETLQQLSHFLNQQLAGDVGGAQDAMDRLVSAGEVLTPQLADVRTNAVEAHEAVDATGKGIGETREALAALIENLDSGAGKSQQQLTELQQSISVLQDDAKSLTEETGPALVDALVQVREASNRARQAASEAIAKAIPEAADQLSAEARAKLQAAVEEVVAEQMRELDNLSARALDSARGASDRLSAQMLSIGQTASALESHMADVDEATREAQSERFGSQVSLLMESLNSAAIDVEKILTDDVDDKSWAAYLKGERGVFTRKAVRLLTAGEAREIGGVYDEDPEFRSAVNRFIHDFESMLRRVLAERDGAIIGVTLMSSDMGKLYAALAQAIERKGR